MLYAVLVPIKYLLSAIGVWQKLLRFGGSRARQTFGYYRPGPRDVIVASYFKSGTNWTMQMAQQIAHRGEAEFEHIHDVVPWPELGERARYAVDPWDMGAAEHSPTGLRIIKTHLPLGNVPYVSSAKYVCVVRDPKDVVVSGYFFVKRIVMGPLMPTLADWKDLMMAEHPFMGSWAVHLESFWRVRNRDNVLFLTYEQMKRDPAGTIVAIAKLMGVDLTAEQRAKVLEKSSFDYMKSIGHKFDPVGIGPPWTRASGAMMRRGAAGKSPEYLSKPDRDAIDKSCRLALEALGSDFPYDEHYAAEPVTG